MQTLAEKNVGFLEAMKTAIADKTLTARQQQDCQTIFNVCNKRPRIGRLVEHYILAKYEDAKGDIVGVVDWAAVIAWFVANIGQILQLLLSFLALFGV